MVTTELTRPQPVRPRHSLAEQLAHAYSAGWTLLLAAAALCALIPAARWLAHHELALQLHVRIRPAPRPTLRAAAWLLIHNARATMWPLLAVGLGAERHRILRRVVDVSVMASVAVNLLPIAAAVGVYRSALVPYLPHLPFELYAITTGPAAWAQSTRQPLGRRQLAMIGLSMLAALGIAALLETWAVPHR
jgi:hypothetical protein